MTELNAALSSYTEKEQVLIARAWNELSEHTLLEVVKKIQDALEWDEAQKIV